MKIKKFFSLNIKKVLLAILLDFIAIILHNAIYGIFGLEEAFFFIIAVLIIPIYLIISAIFTIIELISKKLKK
jgi:hypothetical protein